LRNTGTAAYQDAPDNGAKLIDAQGQACTAEITDTTTAGQPFAGTTNIAPGDVELGVVSFEVPVGTTLAKTQFGLGSGMADQVGQWTMNWVCRPHRPAIGRSILLRVSTLSRDNLHGSRSDNTPTASRQ